MSVVAMLQGEARFDDVTLQSAIAIASRLNVPLEGVCALPDPATGALLVSSPEFPGLIGEVASNLVELQADLVASARQSFDDVTGCGAHGLACSFSHVVATAERAGANAATLSDAIVYHRSAARSGSSPHDGFKHVLMSVRLPVILSASEEMTEGPVVIGWDGSHGAARAVRLHLPLIQAFGDVLIAHQEKDAARDDASAVAEPDVLRDWLSERGVNAQISRLQGDAASGLLALASGAEASMIVAGAYGHSRLGERLFGGTTRRLLDADHAPALALVH